MVPVYVALPCISRPRHRRTVHTGSDCNDVWHTGGRWLDVVALVTSVWYVSLGSVLRHLDPLTV